MNQTKIILSIFLLMSLLGNLYQYKKHQPLKIYSDNKPILNILTEKDPKPENRIPTLPKAKEEKIYQQQLAECEARVVIAQEQRKKYLPLEDRFTEGQPSPELESVLHQKIDPLLTNNSKERLEANIECRADICQIEILRQEGQEIKTVLDKIQSDESLLGIIQNFKIYKGMPFQEASSQKINWKHKLLFEIQL